MVKRNLNVFALVLILLSMDLLAMDFSKQASGGVAKDVALLHKASIFGADYKALDNCIRGEPRPLFNTTMAGVADHFYQAFSAVNSIETVIFTDGTSVTAMHGGCEYYAIGLFYTFPQTGAALNRQSSYEYAARLLIKLEALGVDTIFDFKKAVTTLNKLASGEYQDPCILGCPIIGDEGELGARVNVESYGLMADQKNQYLEIGFNIGPL